MRYRFVVLTVSLPVLLPIAGALAEEGASAQGQAKCRKAEINPVTGHVFCFDPLGAPVEPVPAEAKPACKDEDQRGQWSWAPNCTPGVTSAR